MRRVFDPTRMEVVDRRGMLQRMWGMPLSEETLCANADDVRFNGNVMPEKMNTSTPGGECRMHQLHTGCRGRVVCVEGDREIRRRLLEMGFCRGTAVELIRRAPMGDPIEFSIRGYCVSLRAEQARHVWVTLP
jgi:Fe2+ transport system protein FeoA